MRLNTVFVPSVPDHQFQLIPHFFPNLLTTAFCNVWISCPVFYSNGSLRIPTYIIFPVKITSHPLTWHAYDLSGETPCHSIVTVQQIIVILSSNTNSLRQCLSTFWIVKLLARFCSLPSYSQSEHV